MTQQPPTKASSQEPRGSWRRPSDEDFSRDAVRFGVGPHDLRVEHGDWVHYVKVAPARRDFLRASGGETGGGGVDLSPVGSSDLYGLAMWAVASTGVMLWSAVSWLIGGRPDAATRAARAEAAERDAREKSRVELDAAAKHVGVVLIPSARSWRTDRPQVVEKYVVAPGEPFAAHLASLAQRAASGEFIPAS